MAKIKVFWKKVKRQGHKVKKIFFAMEMSLSPRNVHILYESPTSSGEETMAKI